MGKAELLRQLREQTGSLHISEKEMWQAPSFAPGIARGIVAELLGNARTEWLLALFALHPEHFIFWCEREMQANPTAIQQRGITLNRVKFINSAGDLQQPLKTALESQQYPFVIAPNRFTDIKTYQRFKLLTEKSKSTLFLLAKEEFSSAWPISLQLEINFCEEGFQIEVQRQKHGVRV